MNSCLFFFLLFFLGSIFGDSKTDYVINGTLQEKLQEINDVYWPINIPVVGIYYPTQYSVHLHEVWDPLTLSSYVSQEIKGIGKCDVLLFTDQKEYIEVFNKKFGLQFMYISRLAHNEYSTQADRNEHELLTLLLLAQCDLVITCQSYQNRILEMLNPKLKVIDLASIRK